jgi:hypothetical protein
MLSSGLDQVRSIERAILEFPVPDEIHDGFEVAQARRRMRTSGQDRQAEQWRP